MSLYGPPAGMSVSEACHAIFNHYSSPYKSSLSEQGSEEQLFDTSMDNLSFSRMCRDAPDLAKIIGRHDVDLIFSKAKPVGGRRFLYENFLDAILELSLKLFPEEEPVTALSMCLARYVFALFDQTPAPMSMNVVELIRSELTLSR